MINILKEILIILRTHGKESNLLFLKTVASSVPTVLSLDNGDTIANSYDIANTFNNYFASIAETTKKRKHKIFEMKVVVQYVYNLLIKRK